MGALFLVGILTAIGGWIGENFYDHQLLAGSGIGFIVGILVWIIIKFGVVGESLGNTFDSMSDFGDFDGGD